MSPSSAPAAVLDSRKHRLAKIPQLVQEDYRAEGSGAPVKATRGPGVSGIAWIPYFPGLETLPDCDLRTHPLAHTGLGPLHAIPELFRSGNHRPKERIRDVGEFARELLLFDYRAAFAIAAPTLHVDRQGRPCQFTFWHLYRVGYTAARAGRVTTYLPGEEGSCGPADPVRFTADGVTLDYAVRFRLGKMINVGSRIMTGHWAPFASMAVHYELKLDGSARGHFRGSHVPSQRYYLNWELSGEYDMVRCSGYEFDDFVEAGDGKDAKVFIIGEF